MKRLRMAAFAAVAGLAFVPGCSCFDGQLFNRMGTCPQQQSGCDCCSCGSMSPVGGQGFGEGPYLNPPPGVLETTPPPSKIVPQAQPMPAPVSTTRVKN